VAFVDFIPTGTPPGGSFPKRRFVAVSGMSGCPKAVILASLNGVNPTVPVNMVSADLSSECDQSPLGRFQKGT
jgi:hypothetical protein